MATDAPTLAAPPPPPALVALEHWLPPAVLNQVKPLFTNPQLTPQLANEYALNAVRQTPWYAQTFPGIQAGIQNGLFANEPGYIAYRNSLHQVYNQYTGNPATAAQVAHAATQGFSPGRVAQGLSGEAYLAANKPEILSTLGAFGTGAPVTQPQLQALGKEQANIDSPLGQLMQKRLAQAQERMKGIFSGTLATPSLSLSTGRIAGNPGIGPDTAA